MTPGSRGWLGLAAALAAGAAALFAATPSRFDWQPALAFTEPWRAFSAAAVHYSALHLAANLAGTALVGALGALARVPPAMVGAWLGAWPLTQWGLLARPDLAHYGGLSGVLHAGAAVAAVHLISAGPRPRRLIGVAVLVGILVKVLGESPWGPALRQPAGWDIATAPFSHASGLVAGIGCAVIAVVWRWRRSHGPR